jgi:mannose-6-phosphate isomerase-like protein (cupin superfamily)
MKLFNIRDLYKEKYREYIVGSADTGKHTVYLVYGEVPGGEKRSMAPDGHDEILLLLSGEALLEKSGESIALKQEQAVSMEPDESFTFTALSDCRYVVAGTHTVPHEH